MSQINSKTFITENFLLNGMLDGPFANLIGVHGNKNFNITYEPNPYIELLNSTISHIPSLYNYQLQKRLDEN